MMISVPKRRVGWRELLRVFLAVLGLICCVFLIKDSARSGLSRLFSFISIIQSRLDAADAAVSLTPSDPEAHYTRALTLVNLKRLREAIGELQETTQLRPHHYYEWLDLGVTLDQLGDQTGAAATLGESARLAPYFAQPHWQLGNLLYRQGRFQEAFAELRLGARSNPNLLEGMLDLAWAAADGDAGTIRPDVPILSWRYTWRLGEKAQRPQGKSELWESLKMRASARSCIKRSPLFLQPSNFLMRTLPGPRATV